jgi:hypothetical protein
MKLSIGNITLLTLLDSSSKKNEQRHPVAPKVDSITRPEIDFQFAHTIAQGFYMRCIARQQSLKRDGHFGSCMNVEV